jgi:hypothetical protein
MNTKREYCIYVRTTYGGVRSTYVCTYIARSVAFMLYVVLPCTVYVVCVSSVVGCRARYPVAAISRGERQHSCQLDAACQSV